LALFPRRDFFLKKEAHVPRGNPQPGGFSQVAPGQSFQGLLVQQAGGLFGGDFPDESAAALLGGN